MSAYGAEIGFLDEYQLLYSSCFTIVFTVLHYNYCTLLYDIIKVERLVVYLRMVFSIHKELYAFFLTRLLSSVLIYAVFHRVFLQLHLLYPTIICKHDLLLYTVQNKTFFSQLCVYPQISFSQEVYRVLFFFQ